MRLTTDEVKHIAALARVGITDEEVERMRGQLSDILDHFDVLQQVDTERVDPTGHLAELQSVMRDDEARESSPKDEMLANAPQQEGAYIRVKAVLE